MIDMSEILTAVQELAKSPVIWIVVVGVLAGLIYERFFA